MSFSIIAAVGKNRELGFQGGLIFQIPEDMKFFRRMTLGHPVVMGRKTFFSIGRALPKRLNLVVTRGSSLEMPDGEVVTEVFEGFKKADFEGLSADALGGSDADGGAVQTSGKQGSVKLVRDVEKFIAENVGTKEEIFVIGGGEIYRRFLPFADQICLTEVEATAEADTFFPEFDQKLYKREVLGEGEYEGLRYQFVKYEKQEGK